jgi:hypothetical protein
MRDETHATQPINPGSCEARCQNLGVEVRASVSAATSEHIEYLCRQTFMKPTHSSFSPPTFVSRVKANNGACARVGRRCHDMNVAMQQTNFDVVCRRWSSVVSSATQRRNIDSLLHQ